MCIYVYYILCIRYADLKTVYGSTQDSLRPILTVLDVGIEHAVLCAASVPPQAGPFVFPGVGQPAGQPAPPVPTHNQVRALVSQRPQKTTFVGTGGSGSEYTNILPFQIYHS